MLVLFPACSGKKKQLADAIVDGDSLPTMRTVGVSSLISDSGVIRYKIVAEEWLVFDKTNPPRWAFEKGIFLEKFDEQMVVDAKIKADTAYYYDKQKLWDLRGNVMIRNLKGEKFDTEQLFWNQSTEKVYSDRFIRIEQEDKIITGYGFNSNQQFTDYTILNTAGIFPVEELKSDSVRRDTLN
jgi:LPS export ABC transporter protein LptC